MQLFPRREKSVEAIYASLEQPLQQRLFSPPPPNNGGGNKSVTRSATGGTGISRPPGTDFYELQQNGRVVDVQAHTSGSLAAMSRSMITSHHVSSHSASMEL